MERSQVLRAVVLASILFGALGCCHQAPPPCNCPRAETVCPSVGAPTPDQLVAVQSDQQQVQQVGQGQQIAQQTECVPLPTSQWTVDPMLVIHEATTCRWRVTWNGWDPPRDYDYRPDAEGWIHDYFISGYHGRVFWNLRNNVVWVRPMEGQTLDEEGARSVAQHAARTIFLGIDMSTFQFNPAPCPSFPCAPR